jgi:hypothetical protein
VVIGTKYLKNPLSGFAKASPLFTIKLNKTNIPSVVNIPNTGGNNIFKVFIDFNFHRI